MSDATRILSQAEQSDPQAAEKVLPLVYEELRKLAAARSGREEARPTLKRDFACARSLFAAYRKRRAQTVPRY